MKILKKSLSLLLMFIMFVLVSCSSRTAIPYGKWKSEDPNLIIDINPNGGWFLGSYTIDENIIEVLVEIAAHSDMINIYDNFDIPDDPEDGVWVDDPLFVGDFKIKEDGSLYVKTRLPSIEKNGVKEIVFILIEEYDINETDNESVEE